MKRLSQDAVALVHHIELNESSWWQDVIGRVALTCLLREGDSQDVAALLATMESEFGIRATNNQVRQVLEAMIEAGQAIKLANECFRPTLEARSQAEAALEGLRSLESEVERNFLAALRGQCNCLASPPAWSSFRDECLLPLITHEGAQIISLLGQSSNGEISSNAIINGFIETHDPANTTGLAQCVDGFLRSSDARVHEYILRQLDAHFVVVAAGLDASTLGALAAAKSKKLKLQLVLDTNFIFSVLGWHDHPSNDAARSLLAVSAECDSIVNVDLLVLPITVEETRSALALKAEKLQNIRWSRTLAEAALDYGVPGLVKQYLESCSNADFSITITEYANMISHDLESRLQDLGVMSIYDDISAYSMRPDVLDSINEQLDFERSHRARESQRDYQVIKHDMVAYHWVADQRPGVIQTAIDAGYWLVTLDYRLLGFDRFKSRSSRSTQVCLHPSTAAQLLQFWIPRSDVLEQAVFYSVTQPLHPATTLAATEQVTYRIIERLSTLDGIEDISADAIRDTLADQVLRDRIKDAKNRNEEIELVEQAFVGLVREREQEIAAQKKENAQLSKQLEQARKDLATKDNHVEGRRIQAEKLKRQVENTQAQTVELQVALKQARDDLVTRDERLDRIEQDSQMRTWKDRYVVMPAVVSVFIGAAGSYVLTRLSPPQGFLSCVLLWTLLILVWLAIVVASGRRVAMFRDSKMFRVLASFNRVIWPAIVTLVLGLITSLLWDILRPVIP